MARENIDIQARQIGKQKLIADTAQSAAAIHGLELATEKAGRGMERSSRRSFLWSQAMFTLRRMVYDVTLGLGAAATAVAGFGLQFQLSMEQNTVAMSYLLKSESAARKELDYLYDLAARTPFEFTDLTTASRKLLGFGFQVQDVNRYLVATADAMSAMGGDPEIMNRIVRAFGQISAKGRVMGEELLQLTEAGIPAYQILRDELGLTAKQMSNIGRLGIPANVAIEAIVKGMNTRFAGASEQLANTVTGRLTTMRDYARQLAGEIMLAPFEALRDNMPGAILLLQNMTKAMKDEGFFAMVRVMDSQVGAGGRLVSTLEYLIEAARNLAIIWRTSVWPALRVNGMIILGVLIPAAQILGGVLEILSHGGTTLSAVLAILTFAYIANKVAVIADLIWTKRLTLAKKLEALMSLRLTWATRRETAAKWLNVTVGKAMVFWNTRVTASAFAQWVMMMRLSGAFTLVAARMAVMNFIMAINPIVAVTTVVIGLGLALFYLEKKFQIVSRTIQYTWDKMKDFDRWMGNSKLGKAIRLGLSSASMIVPGLGPVIQSVGRGRGIAEGVQGALGTGAGPGGAFGTATRPAPTQAQQFAAGDLALPEYIEQHTHVMLDKREIAEAMSEVRLIRKARS